MLAATPSPASLWVLRRYVWRMAESKFFIGCGVTLHYSSRGDLLSDIMSSLRFSSWRARLAPSLFMFVVTRLLRGQVVRVVGSWFLDVLVGVFMDGFAFLNFYSKTRTAVFDAVVKWVDFLKVDTNVICSFLENGLRLIHFSFR